MLLQVVKCVAGTAGLCAWWLHSFTGGNAKVQRREVIKAWNRALGGLS